MNKFFSKTKELIFASQTSMLSSTIIISSMIMVSRVFGFIRYRVLTGLFTTEELDIFLAAFRIPDIVFEILITGALTTTFIPFFIKYRSNKESLSKNISTIINAVLLSIGAAIILLYVFMPQITSLIAPGFSEEKAKMITEYSRLLLIGQLPFLVMGNFLTGIGQARKSFIIPAIAPAIYNISIIFFTVYLYDQYYLTAPIIGVIVGAVLFLIVQLPILRYTSFRYRIILNRTVETWNFFKMALPRIFTNVIAQIDATIDLILTTLIGSGSYTMFYFAQHLQLLPISLIGMAFGQASLPYLTELYQEKKLDAFRKIILDSLLNLMYLTVPIMCFLIVARTPIVRLFYGGDKFDWEATVLTAKTLSFFALSIPLHSAYYFLTRCFYAVFDSKTPFLISLFTIIINASLSVLFVLYLKLPVWSLALSFTIGMNLNVIILFILLWLRIKELDIRLFLVESFKIAVSSIIAGCLMFFSQRLLDGLIFDTTRTLNVFFLIVTNGIIFISIYLGMTWLMGIREMYVLTKMVLKIKEYQRKITELYSGVNS